MSGAQWCGAGVAFSLWFVWIVPDSPRALERPGYVEMLRTLKLLTLSAALLYVSGHWIP